MLLKLILTLLLIRFLLISRWEINYLSQFTVTNWRHQNLYFFYLVKDKSAASAGMVAAEASKGMGADEESFNVPVPVTQKVRDACLHKGIKMMQVWLTGNRELCFRFLLITMVNMIIFFHRHTYGQTSTDPENQDSLTEFTQYVSSVIVSFWLMLIITDMYL